MPKARPKPIRGIYEREPGSDVWWIRYTDSNGNKRREKAGLRSYAVNLLAKRKLEKLQALKLPELVPKKAIQFSTLMDDALRHSAAENGDRSTHELKLKIELMRNDWGSRRADQITKQDIQDWLVQQTEEREWSPATRNRYQAAFSLIFRVAVDNEKLTINPASRIKRKPEHNDKIRFLSAGEEKKLTAVIREHWPHYLPAFLVSIHTGMRASEQFGLQWSQISLAEKRITLHRTKAGKTRHIQLNTTAVEMLKGLKGSKSHGHVFLNTENDPLRSARDWFEPAIELAGLKDYTWHCNRHTFASRLVMADVNLPTVAQLMGHSTIQMTMRYAHLAPEHTQAAVDRLVAVESSGSKGHQIGHHKRAEKQTL